LYLLNCAILKIYTSLNRKLMKNYIILILFKRTILDCNSVSVPKILEKFTRILVVISIERDHR